jgi:glycosyltransferase involved in cell wall biosynthesis
MNCPSLIVFSHLRWGIVRQRPQHLMSRLASRWQILFVEEPVHSEGPARLQRSVVAPQLTVLTPQTPIEAHGFDGRQTAALAHLLADHLRANGIRSPLAWLTTAMAQPLLNAVNPAGVIYDCMDEAGAGSDAPAALTQHHDALLRTASLVLTGGPSLHVATRGRHPNVHCIPSSVDVGHFAPNEPAPDTDAARNALALQGDLPHPRLGYFGVIDARLDLRLIAAMAEARPDWQIVMVGPVMGIDAASLPRRPNLHWLGPQPYAVLPSLLAGWDVALIPFVKNTSTRYCTPTQALEYLAGEKPVVSTPIGDVISLYGHAVMIANGASEFIAACDTVLQENAAARCRRVLEAILVVSTNSWRRSADEVHRLLMAARVQAGASPPNRLAEAAERHAPA